MKFFGQVLCGVGMAAMLALPPVARAEGTNTSPDFKEVYELIRSHLAGETEADLNQAAVTGLLNQLHAKASLVGNVNGTNQSTDAPLLSRSLIYDGSIAYLRVGRVGDGLSGKVAKALKELSTTNHLKGVVVDLRFAGGHDYAEAASVADLFISSDTALLDWGKGMVRSKDNADAINLPVAVLINQHTAAAAEALAAVMRQSARAMILGTNTAGEATVGKEFPLKNGQSLRIATAGVKLGNGDALSANGLKADIEVAVKPENEKIWFDDPYKDVPLNSAFAQVNGIGTNAVSRAGRRTTEADLMRMRKEKPGLEIEYGLPLDSPDEKPEKPVIRDPVLGRALDLIKGISVVRQAHTL